MEERVAAARAFFREGYNCCQSVVLAFEDIAGLDKESIIKAACGFGGGMGRMREVCGAVSGMTFCRDRNRCEQTKGGGIL